MSKITVEVKYDIGDTVYFKTGSKVKGVIIGYTIFPKQLLYHVVWGDSRKEDRHFDIELVSNANEQERNFDDDI